MSPEIKKYIERIKNNDLSLQHIVIGPHSVDGFEQLIACLDSNPRVTAQISDIQLLGCKIPVIKEPVLSKLKKLVSVCNDINNQQLKSLYWSLDVESDSEYSDADELDCDIDYLEHHMDRIRVDSSTQADTSIQSNKKLRYRSYS